MNDNHAVKCANCGRETIEQDLGDGQRCSIKPCSVCHYNPDLGDVVETVQKCVRCGYRLGAQNPSDTCVMCRLISGS
jgi:hypothetical protein